MSDDKEKEVRGWQDIMIENKTKSDWVDEVGTSGIKYCGRLCEVILDLEKRLAELEEDLSYYEGAPANDKEFDVWIESKIEKELWSGNYNRATRDEFIAHRVWLHYKKKEVVGCDALDSELRWDILTSDNSSETTSKLIGRLNEVGKVVKATQETLKTVATNLMSIRKLNGGGSIFSMQNKLIADSLKSLGFKGE